jgi:hypothetical protein
MQDVWSPQLTKKIRSFIDRKDRKYPELRKFERWDRYELTPRNSSFDQSSKYRI